MGFYFAAVLYDETCKQISQLRKIRFIFQKFEKVTRPYWGSNSALWGSGIMSWFFSWFIKISLLLAIQEIKTCRSFFNDRWGSFEIFWPFQDENLRKICRERRCRAESITLHDDLVFIEKSLQTTPWDMKDHYSKGYSYPLPNSLRISCQKMCKYHLFTRYISSKKYNCISAKREALLKKNLRGLRLVA